MSLYNTLNLELTCPHCRSDIQAEAEFRFGELSLKTYRLGDRLQWESAQRRPPVGRPKDGDYDGEAYIECPLCGKDFWLLISVKNDIIQSAQLKSKSGYIT